MRWNWKLEYISSFDRSYVQIDAIEYEAQQRRLAHLYAENEAHKRKIAKVTHLFEEVALPIFDSHSEEINQKLVVTNKELEEENLALEKVLYLFDSHCEEILQQNKALMNISVLYQKLVVTNKELEEENLALETVLRLFIWYAPLIPLHQLENLSDCYERAMNLFKHSPSAG